MGKLSSTKSPDAYWLKRLHTLVLTGNGAALVLLVTLFGKTEAPIHAIQEHIIYFVPFLIGITFAVAAVIIGIDVENLEKQEVVGEGEDK